MQYAEFSEATQEQLRRDQQRKQLINNTIKSKSVVVPTKDEDVRLYLRLCNEPMCLFGEGAVDRRDRLKKIYVEKNLTNEIIQQLKEQSGLFQTKTIKQNQVLEETHSLVSKEMMDLRYKLSDYSFKKAKARIEYNQELDTNMDLFKDYEQSIAKKWKYNHIMEVNVTNTCCSRPLDSIRYSPSGRTVLVSSFSGEVSLWDMDAMKETKSFLAHELRTDTVAWSPSFQEDNPEQSTISFATGSLTNEIKLWNIHSSTPLHQLNGHLSRVSRVLFHPFFPWLLSASYDTTLRLWDLTTAQELSLQDRHAAEIHALALHPDGSLYFSGDRSGVGRLWDLRCGQHIEPLDKHIKGIIDADFNSNGYTLATGSEDNSIKLWDLRKMKPYYTLPAHNSTVSRCVFDPTGEFLFSSSFDQSIKIWSMRNNTCIKILNGHDTRICDMDIHTHQDETHIVSAAANKVWKLWKPSEFLL